ncbi:MAG: acyl--CoA ligase [Bordetella sp.]|nr:acyl--CoA ligase [Bordetella sp.]
MNLARDLERRAAEAPERTALWHEDGRAWSFGRLNALSGAVGQRMLGAGAKAGDRIGLFFVNSPELVISMFAAWKVGLVPVMLSGLYNGAELADAHAKTPFTLLVAMDRLRGSVDQANLELPGLWFGAGADDDLWNAGEAVVAAPDLGDADAAILFTGGTTGEPKAVALTHAGVIEAMTKFARAAKGRPGPYALAPEGVPPNLVTMALFHGGGQQSLLLAFFVGRPVVIMERFRPETVFELVARHGIDNLSLMPTMIYDLTRYRGEGELGSLKSVMVTGGAAPPEIAREFEARYRVPLLTNYGSTETGHVAGWTARAVARGEWLPGSVGKIYEGVEVEIRDEDGKALATGETGEITVRTPMTRGYVDGGAGDGDRALVQDGWVASGDIGHIDENGVLFLSGRKRELIKVGGFQVWPSEIENTLRTHPDVADVAVTGVPDERLGEAPRAYVVLREPQKDHSGAEASLIAYCRERLSHFKAIRSVVFIEQLPRTEAGKINRRALVA